MKTKCRTTRGLLMTLAQTVLVLGLATTAFAQTKDELDNKVRKLMSQFDSLQANTDARIPAEKLKKAQAKAEGEEHGEDVCTLNRLLRRCLDAYLSEAASG